jgi:PAS domain S-box-containing protein
MIHTTQAAPRHGAGGRQFAGGVLLVLLSGLVLPVAGSFLAAEVLPRFRWENIPIHAGVEAVGGVMSLMLGLILLSLRKGEPDNQYYVWMASALLVMGILDITHAACPPGQMFVWFRATSTFLSGMLFLGVWLPAAAADSPRHRLVPQFAVAGAIALIVVSLGFPYLVPDMVSNGAFTLTARATNILGGLAYLAATVWLVRRYRLVGARKDCFFACLCGLFGSAGVLFELSSLWDAPWWWWHVLRLAAFTLVIGYSIVEYRRIDEALRQSEAHQRSLAESLARRNELQAVISGLFQKALTSETVEEVTQTCLGSAIDFVGCDFGFIGELNDRGRFDTLALSDPGWEACRMPEAEALVSIRDMEVRGLWGRVIADGASLLTNEPGSHPDRVGLPEGHPPLTSFLGVPLIQEDRPIGMIALANKKDGFDRADREDMELLSETLVEALMRKQAELELRRHRDHLEIMVQERVKERRCLYDISEAIAHREARFETILGRIPALLPPGWRYPEITCARVVYDGQEYATDDFRETQWSLSEPIYTSGDKSGLVQVCYLEEMPDQDEGPFLKEEKDLIEEVAGRLGGLINQHLAERERLRTEEALRESEANYRSIFDGAEDVIFIHDLTDGRILDVNRKVEELFGYSRDEALQLSMDDLGAGHEPYTQADAVKWIQKAVQEGPQVVEWQCRHKNGRLFWTENSLKMADIGGERRLLAVLRDISDRKKAEAALEYEQAQLLALFEGIEDVMYVSDPETYELLYVNTALRQNWGDDVIGQKCYAVLQNRDAPCPFCTNDTIFGEKLGQTHVWEFQNEVTERWYRCADKAIKWADGRMVRFEIAGDITEGKRLEQERAELMNEMEGKNAELERFTYTVSHDLKSPLITIKGFMGLLEQDAVAGDTDRVKDDVARITAAVEKMSLLLEELLELSRIGRLMNPPEDVPLGELVQEAVDMVEGLIKERGVEVSIQPDLPVVHGDRIRLREVLENLVSNAAKFMGDQADPKIEIGVEREDREPVFFVRDNGIGIEPQYHAKVFDLFEQLEQTEGTGIGLALVKRIVEVHGGRIWVDSAGANKGTTFHFTLSGSEKEKE